MIKKLKNIIINLNFVKKCSAAHGVLRLVIELVGETVVRVDPQKILLSGWIIKVKKKNNNSKSKKRINNRIIKRYYNKTNIVLGGGISKNLGSYIPNRKENKFNEWSNNYISVKRPTRTYMENLKKNQERYDLKKHKNNASDLDNLKEDLNKNFESVIIGVPCIKVYSSENIKEVKKCIEVEINKELDQNLVTKIEIERNVQIEQNKESHLVSAYELMVNNNLNKCRHGRLIYTNKESKLTIIATSKGKIVQNTIMDKNTGDLASYYKKMNSQTIVRYNNQIGFEPKSEIMYSSNEILTNIDINIIKKLGEKGLLFYYKIDRDIDYQEIYNNNKNVLRIEEKLMLAQKVCDNINSNITKSKNIYETGVISTEKFQTIVNEVRNNEEQIDDHLVYNFKLWVNMENKKNYIIFNNEKRINNFDSYNKGLDRYFNKLDCTGKNYIINIVNTDNEDEILKIVNEIKLDVKIFEEVEDNE